MRTTKVAFFTAVTNSLVPFSKAAAAVRSDFPGVVETVAKDRIDMSESATWNWFLVEISNADVLLVQLMGGKTSFPHMDEFMAKLPASVGVFVFPSSASAADVASEYTTVSADVAERITGYMTHSGEKNWQHLLRYLAATFGQANVGWNEPAPLPWQGIYHPDHGVSEDLSAYQRDHLDPNQPTIGVWFHRGSWISGNVAYIDAIVRTIESSGANALAVFFQSGTMHEPGCMSFVEVVRSLMSVNGVSVVDAVLRCLMFSLTIMQNDEKREDDIDALNLLNAPVLNVVPASTDRARWEADLQGLDPVTLSISVILPELDGSLISVPVAFKERSEVDPATGARLVMHEPHGERVQAAVNLALRWAALSRTPNNEKRIAILFHNYPPGEANIGAAYLLDSVKSVWNILGRLQAEGYDVRGVPDSSEELIRHIKNGFTADPRWSTPEDGNTEAAAAVPLSTFEDWAAELPSRAKTQMASQWGKPQTVAHQGARGVLIPGRLYGKVYVGMQPSRGFAEDPGAAYHSPDIPPPHYYYAYYRWLREGFSADAILHIGKHGSLEWLPGKGSGLSRECYPDIMLRDLPNVYPYVINNPGEGTQAKRRSAACIIDHNVPVLDIAGTYDELAELERLSEEYRTAETESPQKLDSIRESMIESIVAASLQEDLGVEESSLHDEFETVRKCLHEYLGKIKHTLVRDGLHCFGEAPEGHMLEKMLYSLTRLPNGEVPSLHDTIGELLGADPEEPTEKSRVYEVCRSVLAELAQAAYDHHRAADICRRVVGRSNSAAVKVLTFIATDLRKRLERTTDELEHTVRALAGGFVPAGPSGSPSRGMAHILPTGRNFYSVDPRVLPTQAAWRVGKDLAEQLIRRYEAENGEVPRQVGIVVWGSPTMRTKGDDIAEILYLLGVTPVWNPANGYVTDLRPIPVEELGRPRVDVTIRISGFFRDALPQLVALLDRAVRLVAALEEPAAENPIRAGVATEARALAEEGYAEDDIASMAGARVFGPKPGAYGAGVSHLIDNQNWKDDSDLARVYIEWGSYAYTQARYGVKQTESFKRRLAGVDIAVKNVDHRESDIMDSDDYYQYHGGMVAAVRSLSGSAPACYIGNSSNPSRVETHTAAEETKLVFRTRVLNPKWIDAMKRHGHKGALDIARTVDYAFGWDATAEVIDDWMYSKIQERYLDDDATREWMEEANPAAVQAMIERLLEAVDRGMWHASEEELERLKHRYLENEELLERGHDHTATPI